MAQHHDENPIARDHHRVEPSTGDLVGEGVGGASGALTGAALGTPGGPLGVLVGGIAGAVGGWWTGRSVSEAAAHYTDEDERHYRKHWESRSNQPAGWDYDRARSGYVIGHIAAHNPEYRDRDFDEVWTEMRPGFQDEHEKDYEGMREYARAGYERSLTTIRPSDDGDRVVVR